jgi:hypothetical protein
MAPPPKAIFTYSNALTCSTLLSIHNPLSRITLTAASKPNQKVAANRCQSRMLMGCNLPYCFMLL